jgi:phosphoglycolate phosphatase
MTNFPAVRGLIFDLDGTLLDTLGDIANAATEALASMGLPSPPFEKFRSYVGEGMLHLVTRCLPEEQRDEATIHELLSRYRAAYARHWHQTARPYDGIRELLTALAARRVPMAVLSNKPHGFTLQCMAHFLSDFHFDPILGQREGIPHKPDPTGAHEIATRWQAAPESILFIGDTETDLATAQRAGMRPIGVTWGFRSRDTLHAAGAETLLDAPHALLSLLPA